MKKEKRKNNAFETIEMVKDATVIYWDGEKELFDAIRVTNRGVVIGRILKMNEKEGMCNNCCEVFVESGFIPTDNIMSIEGGVSWKRYKKKS